MGNVLKNLPSWYPEGKEKEEIGDKCLKKKEGRKGKKKTILLNTRGDTLSKFLSYG